MLVHVNHALQEACACRYAGDALKTVAGYAFTHRLQGDVRCIPPLHLVSHSGLCITERTVIYKWRGDMLLPPCYDVPSVQGPDVMTRSLV